MILVSTDIKNIQPGDRILLASEVLTVKALDGPDHIGTYDIFCLNSQGLPSQRIANGSVIIVQ